MLKCPFCEGRLRITGAELGTGPGSPAPHILALTSGLHLFDSGGSKFHLVTLQSIISHKKAKFSVGHRIAEQQVTRQSVQTSVIGDQEKKMS